MVKQKQDYTLVYMNMAARQNSLLKLESTVQRGIFAPYCKIKQQMDERT